MLRQILMVSTALCAVTLISATDAPQASAAMRIPLPTYELSPIQLVAYDPLVYRAQVGLTRNGFDTGTPDGKMGPRTRGAIEAYQRANGMSVTGWASDSLVAQLEGSQPARADRFGDRRRARIAQSELINQTQNELRRHGYNFDFAGGQLNGATTDAIRDYQRAHGLERTGTPSEPLLAMMRRDTATVRPGQGARGDRSFDQRGNRLSQNELIDQTQVELRRHGYNITYVNDGLTGETTDAIRSYQQSRGLERTGAPSEPLLAMMRSDNRVSGPAPTPTYGSVPVVAAQPVQCADFLHQGRPGGTDYQGPAVPGCP
jgi:peptidoglycan hydrolase-like protein with peptidoglycan-binding domain